MSGECLCGAYAKRGELDEIALWYPDVAARIRDLERRVAANGLAYNRWEARYTDRIARRQLEIFSDEALMCSSCAIGESAA